MALLRVSKKKLTIVTFDVWYRWHSRSWAFPPHLVTSVWSRLSHSRIIYFRTFERGVGRECDSLAPARSRSLSSHFFHFVLKLSSVGIVIFSNVWIYIRTCVRALCWLFQISLSLWNRSEDVRFNIWFSHMAEVNLFEIQLINLIRRMWIFAWKFLAVIAIKSFDIPKEFLMDLQRAYSFFFLSKMGKKL